jgi:hypothetical protein
MIWSVILLGLMIWFDAVPQWVVWLSLLYPAYHIGVSFYLYVGRGKRRELGGIDVGVVE